MQLLLVIISSLLFAGAQFSDFIDDSENDDLLVDIKILGLFQFTPNLESLEYIPGKIIQTSVEMACKDIAKTENLLSGYRMTLQAADSGCDVARAAFHFAEDALKSTTPVVVLGPRCEEPTRLLGQIVENNVITVSYGARTAGLNDPYEYKRFFRAVAPHTELNRAVHRLLVTYAWERICILIEGVNEYIDLAEHFVNYLKQESFIPFTIIHIVTERNPEFLIDSFCRIFVVFADERNYPYIACEMYKVNLAGVGHYQSIFIGKFNTDWLQYVPLDCSLNDSARSSISVHFQEITEPDINSGDDQQAFESRLYAELSASEYPTNFDYQIAAAAYDATWAIALALNASIDALAQVNLTLEDYLPLSASHDTSDIIVAQFEKISFQGIYKTVNFTTDRHYPYEDIMVSQFQEDMMVPVAVYNFLSDNFTRFSAPPVWIGESPPSDRPIEIVTNFPENSLYIISITMFGLITCLFFFIFNCYFRNKKVIKASSPHINNIIILGCVMSFLSITSYVLDTNYSVPTDARHVFCNSTLWLVFSGFTLSFGSLTIKTWRVYKIFQNPWSQRRLYKDSSLILIIFGLLGLDVVILTLMSGVAPFSSKESSMSTTQSTVRFLVCEQQQYTEIFINALLIYKVMIIAVAGFLALQTRKIKSKAFTDSKTISVAIYIIVFSTIFGVPLAIITVFSGQYLLSSSTIVALLSLQGFAIILVVFIPKTYSLWQTRKATTTTLVVTEATEQANGIKYERRSSEYYRANPKGMKKIVSTSVLLEHPEETTDD